MATKAKTAEQPNAENDNLAIWNALGKTDPAHTKGFSRAGGFKGTAIKPIWVTHRLTELFGPCGKGWGIGEPKFEVVQAGDEAMVYCTVECWYAAGDPGKCASLYGVGGDKIVTKRNDGKLFHDDEAFKKAFTDAIGNAFKFVGVGADVHMGLFDDNKYVEAMRHEFADKPANDGDVDDLKDPRREPLPRQELEGPHKSKTHLRQAIIALIGQVREAATTEEIDTLLKASKATIAQANHYWPSLIEGHPDIEEDMGLKGAVTLRREALALNGEGEDYKLMLDGLAACETRAQLQAFVNANGDTIEALDGAQSRKFQIAYDFRASLINEMDKVGA